jgi:ATP-dependent helicase/nuclease subunit B
MMYWRLRGGAPSGEILSFKHDPMELAHAAAAGLAALVSRYDDEATPYPAKPRPAWAPRHEAYDHLARFQEWSAGQGASE